MIPMQRYVEQGLVELQAKTLKQIQIETARTWCGRACAAAELGLPADAIEYGHEAVEHAALSGDDGLLNEVRSALDSFGVER